VSQRTSERFLRSVAILSAIWLSGSPTLAAQDGAVRARERSWPAKRVATSADSAGVVPSPETGARPLPIDASSTSADVSPVVEPRSSEDIERALLDAGLENVTVSSGGIPIAYENRRYRRSVEALARARTAAGRPILVGERRLGLIAAALESPDIGTQGRFRVHFPSDADFPRQPAGRMRSTTFARVDLDVGALVDYSVGNIYNPFQASTDLDLRLLLNPWPGARTRVSVAFPLQNDFNTGTLGEDVNHIRLSQASLDQFGWIPGAALVSFSTGYFGDNRWGVSAGAARPLRGGEWLLDLQVERTGFFATGGEGTLYSPLERTSGFAGVTYRPPVADLALKARAGQFLYGDRGADLELRRSFDDVDVAYYVQRTDGLYFYGIRLDLPIPPRTRSSGTPLRVQPTPRFALEFRDQDLAYGTFVSGVASREDHLRQLSRTSLEAGRARYQSALGRPVPTPAKAPGEWVSFTGMTGFIHTPWAGVLADRDLEVGYGLVPRRWAYDHRGTNENQVFYTTLGFLPRVETSLRWTRIPGYRSFEEVAPDSRLVDMDRMASARVAVFQPADGRPGLSVGMEDAQGQRRFHSTYAVAGLPFSFSGQECRLAAGYGFEMFTAARRVLEGAFGAAELSPWPWLRAQVEYDSEKWNAGLGVSPGAGFRIRAALLNMESAEVGAGWSHKL